VGLKPFRERALSTMIQGLNRTSVGLKPLMEQAEALLHAAPQSNQRGIETGVTQGDRNRLTTIASIEPAWD